MTSLARDLRYALRLIRRRPAVAAAAILTFALGIGANTAIFTVVNAVLFKPLPYASSDRLMFVSIDANTGFGDRTWCPGRVIRGVNAGARRPDGKARRARILDIFERGATQPAGMPRPAVMLRVTRPGN